MQEQEKSIVERGFTLIELLVVIAILGILAAVAIFAVGGITGTAKKNACQTEVSEVQTALEAYNAQVPGYPAKTAAVGTDDSSAQTVTDLAVLAAATPNKFLAQPLTAASVSIVKGFKYQDNGGFGAGNCT